jgi:5-methylcytosine-specific restriction endonuclease McrA
MRVFKRDNWCCWLCGGHAPPELRGTTNDLAPEIDHVIPLSRGGGHTYSNVACAHRKCNAAKGAAIVCAPPRKAA